MALLWHKIQSTCALADRTSGGTHQHKTTLVVRYVITRNAPVFEEILLLHFDYPLNVLHNGRARVEDIDCEALLFQYEAAPATSQPNPTQPEMGVPVPQRNLVKAATSGRSRSRAYKRREYTSEENTRS
jgi:hypothetical protein